MVTKILRQIDAVVQQPNFVLPPEFDAYRIWSVEIQQRVRWWVRPSETYTLDLDGPRRSENEDAYHVSIVHPHPERYDRNRLDRQLADIVTEVFQRDANPSVSEMRVYPHATKFSIDRTTPEPPFPSRVEAVVRSVTPHLLATEIRIRYEK